MLTRCKERQAVFLFLLRMKVSELSNASATCHIFESILIYLYIQELKSLTSFRSPVDIWKSNCNRNADFVRKNG